MKTKDGYHSPRDADLCRAFGDPDVTQELDPAEVESLAAEYAARVGRGPEPEPGPLTFDWAEGD